MRRMMSFMTGAVMGGLVGATLGLLLTPYSGNDLQAEVRARIERVQQEMKSAAQSRREELEAQLEALRAPLPPRMIRTLCRPNQPVNDLIDLKANGGSLAPAVGLFDESRRHGACFHQGLFHSRGRASTTPTCVYV